MLQFLPVSAVIGVDFTIYATKARWAGAGVTVDTVSTVGPIFARVTFTLINILFTASPTKTRQTCTGERVNAIPTQATITTGI